MERDPEAAGMYSSTSESESRVSDNSRTDSRVRLVDFLEGEGGSCLITIPMVLSRLMEVSSLSRTVDDSFADVWRGRTRRPALEMLDTNIQ